jgi:hypothetical protein
MKKIVLFLAVIALFACSGGGGGSDEGTQPEKITVESLTVEEFLGKTMYLVETDVGWTKAIFYENFDLNAYEPNQVDWYEKGRWSVTNGKLMCFPDGSDEGAVYELIDNDEANRVYIMERTSPDGTIDTVWIYYDQETAFQQVTM